MTTGRPRGIADADQRVAELLDGEIAHRLRTIPGVGPAIAATLMAERGDLFAGALAFAQRLPALG